MKCYSIGQVAQKTDFSVQTLRYYETMGLIECDHRSPSGYRYFSDATVMRLYFIRHLKNMNFTIKEIQDVLEAADKGNVTLSAMEPIFKQKIQDIAKEIENLKATKMLAEKRFNWCLQHSSTAIAELVQNPDLLEEVQ